MHPLFASIDRLKRDFVVGSDPSLYATCPSCRYFVARSEPGATEKATCPDCKIDFCTNCVGIYHYRSTCLEARQLRENWRTWAISGRAEYWKDNEKMRLQAKRVAAAEKKRVSDVRRAEQIDEKWKADNCRHCPHCNRLVNKLIGCHAMRCGYHSVTGGNVQDGCRKPFDWTKARPYKPLKSGANIKMEVLHQARKKTHGEWDRCDFCEKEIVGLKISCVNCASFSMCEKCDAENAATHHVRGHFFQIIKPSSD
jgi:hypothetical protein